MIPFFVGIVSCLGIFFRSRYNLGLEIFALRQQLGVLERKNPRPRLRFHDRIGVYAAVLQAGVIPCTLS